jgi:hypothetical protein
MIVGTASAALVPPAATRKAQKMIEAINWRTAGTPGMLLRFGAL